MSATPRPWEIVQWSAKSNTYAVGTTGGAVSFTIRPKTGWPADTQFLADVNLVRCAVNSFDDLVAALELALGVATAVEQLLPAIRREDVEAVNVIVGLIKGSGDLIEAAVAKARQS